MIGCDALIVGGGPAGSTCARSLVRAGWNVAVVDRARFPRDKVCAGWLTPRVFPALELDPAEYRAAGLTLQEIRGFRTGVLGRPLIETRYQEVASYAVRRCEFDNFLLQRSGARLLDATCVESIRRDGARWIVNDAIESAVVVGAGGHFCPVSRYLRGGTDTARPVVAKEAEFRLDPNRASRQSEAPALFFCRDFEGYGWCVRKGDYLNVGIGRRESEDFGGHVREFIAFLEHEHGVPVGSARAWKGHAYLASGTGPRPLVAPGMLVIGDAAGLAYPESGEGIWPAIQSARLAADTLISAKPRHAVEDLQPYADTLRRLHPPVSRPSQPVRRVSAAIGRALLGSRAFTRHVLLDRWFLRTHAGQSGKSVQFGDRTD